VGTGGSAYLYNPSGSPWTFVGNAGVSGNGSGFTSGNPSAPQGSQVAFVQMTGSISQAVTFTAGSFAISFSAAQPQHFHFGNQADPGRMHGPRVGTQCPGGTWYAAYPTNSSTVTAGAPALAYVGLTPSGGHNTAFRDQAASSPASPPPPPPQNQPQ